MGETWKGKIEQKCSNWINEKEYTNEKREKVMRARERESDESYDLAKKDQFAIIIMTFNKIFNSI